MRKQIFCKKLSSENSFAKEFNVNRHTVRKSLTLLKDGESIYNGIRGFKL